MGGPAHRDITAVVRGVGRGLNAGWVGRSCAKVDTESLRTGRMGRELEAGADLYGHIVNNRRNILRQVVDCNFVNLGRRVGRLQDGPPLYKARCWNIQA